MNYARERYLDNGNRMGKRMGLGLWIGFEIPSFT